MGRLFSLGLAIIGSCMISGYSYGSNDEVKGNIAKVNIDKVLVEKSKRKLYLMSGRNIVKSYNISLGKKPSGHKLMEGDKKTPEGLYWIDWRKPSSKYNLAMHISYPNSKDMANAKKLGVKPGSMIMIHGTPVDPQYPEWYFRGLNWTNGCIAMMNWDMKEVWSLVKDGTLIEIKP